MCLIDTFRSHHPTRGGHALRVLSLVRSLQDNAHLVKLVRPENQTDANEIEQSVIVWIRFPHHLRRLIHFLQFRLFAERQHFSDTLLMNLPSSLVQMDRYIRSADIVQLEDPTLLGPLLVGLFRRRYCVFDGEGISSEVIRNEIERRKSIEMRFRLTYAIVFLSERLLCRLSSRIVTSSLGDKRVLARLHRLQSHKISVIPNPIDMDLRTPAVREGQEIRRGYDITTDTPVVAFVGNLRSPHNYEAADYIARQLASNDELRKRNVHFMIVGHFDNLQKDWLDSRVIFTGSVENVSKYVGAADVCIAPLLSQPTGIKTKILAYLACGKKVVATPIALTGLDPSLRKYVLECSHNEFPRAILDQIDRREEEAEKWNIMERVVALYGPDAVWERYRKEILESPQIRALRLEGQYLAGNTNQTQIRSPKS